MQLVVEGTAQFRRIISVGIDGDQYALGPDQAIRIIDNAGWHGQRKSEIEWDEQNKIMIPKRQVALDAETEEKRQQDVNAEIAEKIPDMLRRQVSWEEMQAEAKTIDDASLASR